MYNLFDYDYIFSATMIYIDAIFLILKLFGLIIVAAANDSDDDWNIIDKNIKKNFKTNSSPYNSFLWNLLIRFLKFIRFL
jgi:hypothetical protein